MLPQDPHDHGWVHAGILVHDQVAESTHPDHDVSHDGIQESSLAQDFKGLRIGRRGPESPIGDDVRGDVQAYLNSLNYS